MTWRVGDLAVCVSDERIAFNGADIAGFWPIKGEVYLVTEIDWDVDVCCLTFGERDNVHMFDAPDFRKVIKDGTAEKAKTSIKDLLGETA